MKKDYQFDQLGVFYTTPSERAPGSVLRTLVNAHVEPRYRMESDGLFWIGFGNVGKRGVSHAMIPVSGNRPWAKHRNDAVVEVVVEADSLEDAVEMAKTYLLLAQAA